jgi:hypothetical protein
MQRRIDSIIFDLKEVIEDLEQEIKQLIDKNRDMARKFRQYEKKE